MNYYIDENVLDIKTSKTVTVISNPKERKTLSKEALISNLLDSISEKFPMENRNEHEKEGEYTKAFINLLNLHDKNK